MFPCSGTVNRLARGFLALCFAAGAASASAAYPDRPITLVVTYPPGGTVDVVARLIGPELGKALGQSVIIENKGGAGGMIGEGYVARSKPDGYTLMLDASNFAQNPALRSHMNFDVQKDFAPVSLLLKVPNVLVVNPGSSIHSVADLIKQGKDPSHPVYFASAGPGSAQHLAGELFNLLAGTQLKHVPYKGGGPAMIDVMAGQVPLMFASLGSSWTHIKAGKLRAVAVGSTARSPLMPNVPTIAESGVAGYSSYEWNGIFAPAGTPKPALDKVSAALTRVLGEPQVRKQLEALGADVVASDPAQLSAFVNEEIAKWTKVAHTAHLKLD
ncbi:tripartite tricarboxylate transporter substrate binding protein [Candidimonas humi]|uniref:Tripartite tricarboxylate transporter substrate binding protein n=1 Tax=Candidimonas humi TaxID=683355 RepID=A0ABV8P2Y2_9BURK|nr:tripartite tricarboxylate transporter substrate binding protein [Candidimonas humi]MBV6305512.1 tripartite tricarboxylate transporter substrate binding protein [Candidimonas humi]